MIVVTGLKTCDTCRRAIRELTAAGRPARLRDLRAEPARRQEVVGWHETFGKALLNTRSTTWRGLSEAERGGDPIDLILAHPALMKRPLIVLPDAAPRLGWGSETRADLLI